jgi:hypothetical protein
VNLSEITYSKVRAEIETYLKDTYNKAGVLFSPASPYGQILNVMESLYQYSFLYLKNSINQFDLSLPNSNNKKIIRNAAIFAGHIPGRSISATGTLRFHLKSDIDIEKEIPGNRITLFDKTAIKNKQNGLEYIINLGAEKISYKVSPGFQFFASLTQGKWDTQILTGSGQQNQTFQINNPGGQKEIENFNITVTVNGDLWVVKKHLYDMLPDENACVVRTGFNGGIDVIFGNGGFGAIPTLGAEIKVSYIITDGSRGSIFRRTLNDWKILDNVMDGFGNTIDLAKIFDIYIHTDINFGADSESIQFTKNVLPIVSNNFVLGLPQQYAYEIKKLGVFSHINAYEKDGVIHVVATPNIKVFKNQNANYFTVDKRAFELDTYEKIKIDKYLRTAGNIQLTRKYKIVAPVLSYYIMNVFVITYSDSIDDNVNNQIYDKVSEYFLNLSRLNRIPKLDLIKELSSIDDIHSVDIQFVSKKNEDYHKSNKINDANRRNQFAAKGALRLSRPFIGYDKSKVLGIDPVMGDIMYDSEELPIIRGGWYDRNNIYYSDNVTSSGFSSVNIIKKGVVDAKQRPKF